jgi:hypothetical protein
LQYRNETSINFPPDSIYMDIYCNNEPPNAKMKMKIENIIAANLDSLSYITSLSISNIVITPFRNNHLA